MSETRYAGRVGLWVFVGLVVIAALMLNFSRGVGMFKGKYDIKMRARTVAGLKPRSAVYLSGIQIGNVRAVELDQANTNVIVYLQILEDYPLRADAKFVIEQIGVLGDQFVIVYPGSPNAPLLKDGAEVFGSEPFNLQELARSTTDLLKRFESLGQTVGTAIERVNTQLLDAQTLSNVSRTFGNFHVLSERTLGVVDGVATLVTNNAAPFTESISNLIAFTDRMEKLAGELSETVASNRTGLTASLQNMQDATATLKSLSADVDAGRGVIGGLMKDEQLRVQISSTVSNLSILSSNLNRFGLLYKPKQPKNTAQPVYPGKSPFK
jgi:phospholipid/cholesterol/gamma-HCH transport system substrate-binding protein